MDLRPSICGFFLFILFMVVSTVSANGVFKVQHKFAGMEQSVNAIRAHDVHRHRRFLYGIDVPLGGNGHPADTGLYFTKLGIGSPSKDYYVHVDTGSDIFWVNCIECTQCPKKSSLHIDLTLYDPKASATGEMVTCDQDFCTAAAQGPIPGCTSNLNCVYSTVYGDGSSSTGYFVRDVVQYNQVSGNLQTTPANGSVVFGCGAQQSGNLLSSTAALDGLLGFGQSNLSMISQLASSGKVKKIFTHCLSGVKGGGIFAIGQVVQPTVKTTPLIPNQLHYNVNLTAIEVGGVDLQLPTNVFVTSDQKGTIIDSGTTLAYLSKEIYEPLMSKIMSQHSDLQLQIVEGQVSCFQYTQSVDDGFPNVTFHFENSLSLLVYPHDYLFQLPGYGWCIGWQDSGNLIEETQELTILGDLVLSNKLVIYDLELQTIGWTEYDCSSNITLKDENSGAEYLVAAHDLSPTSSAWSWDIGRLTQLLLLTTILHHIIY